jgi:Zn-dependent protease with chaperone function
MAVEARARVPAVYYDGKQSTPHAVIVSIDAETIIVDGDGIRRAASLYEVEITEPLGTAPRLIRFQDGAFCEFDDAAALATLLGSRGIKPPGVTRWEGSLKWVAVAAVLFVATLVVGYRYGVPALAAVAAEQVPAPVVELISSQVLAALDMQVFEATAVPSDRQTRLTDRFRRLRFPAGVDSSGYDITFRKSELLGANAMAMPSGTLVVTDALVTLTPEDEEIVAVLAHEAGHVAGRHGLRQLFQNSVVALAVTWLVGDVSVLAAAAPTALLQAKYSRDLEREADAYALDLLRLNDISTEHFARMLQRLEESAGGGETVAGGTLDYLSSHPVTSERIERVRQSR